jgi:hypothetical protein
MLVAGSAALLAGIGNPPTHYQRGTAPPKCPRSPRLSYPCPGSGNRP